VSLLDSDRSPQRFVTTGNVYNVSWSAKIKKPMQRDEQISRVIFTYATRIGEARETDAVLRLNADMARDLVGADRCSIWLIDDKNQQLWTKVAHGMPEIRTPLGQGLAGACIDGNETIVDTHNGTTTETKVKSAPPTAPPAVVPPAPPVPVPAPPK